MNAAREIEDRAARWLIRREELGWSEADQDELDAWLEESMAHKAAYWRLEHGWRQADRISSLGTAATPVSRTYAWRRFAGAWKPVAVAASVLLALTIIFRVVQPFLPGEAPAPQPQMIATTVGGHRVVPLDDGSRIELNTATTLRTAVKSGSREVWLERGEAYFEVAHVEGRPFVVHAGPRTITVLGTKFSVRRDGERVTVSVLEGRVRIDDARPQGAEVSSSTIAAGNVAIARGPSMLVASR